MTPSIVDGKDVPNFECIINYAPLYLRMLFTPPPQKWYEKPENPLLPSPGEYQKSSGRI
jgi:hypothetical protein